jgi:hypothetical protein
MKATFRPFSMLSDYSVGKMYEYVLYLYFLMKPVSVMVHPWWQENHPLVPELQRGDLCRYILTR